MTTKDVFTQEELDKAIADSFTPVCKGDREFEVFGQAQVRAYGQAQVTATDQAQVWAFGQALVTAYGQAQVTATDQAQVRAYGQAQVTAFGQAQVTATDQAQVTATGQAQVWAYGQAQVRAYGQAQVTATDQAQVWAYGPALVTAYGQAQVRAYGQAQVTATKYNAVTLQDGFGGTATGGVQIQIPPVKTVEEWCDFYGVEIKQGVAVLYKGTDENYKTLRDFAYIPGTKPTAPDWDGGEEECGGGLHFSPRPIDTLKFDPDAKHFIACPVRVEEIVVHYPASYPDKVKAPRVCAPCYEVDIDENRIDEAQKESEAK